MTDIKAPDVRARPQLTLEDLGYLPEQVKELAAMADSSPGLRIISGVTGSGRSTAVAAVVALAQQSNANVVVLQDDLAPAFQGLPHIRVDAIEKSFDAERGPWDRALRQGIRSAPDLFVVGELRDEKSIRAAFELVASGYSVWTTVVAASANDTLRRLRSMCVKDIDDLLYSPSVVTGLIHHTQAPKESGGYQILAEVIRPDEDYLFTYRMHGAEAARTRWMQCPGQLTHREVALRKVQEGLLDPGWWDQHFNSSAS
jgi:Tfp pilus assembly ATPase PilU